MNHCLDLWNTVLPANELFGLNSLSEVQLCYSTTLVSTRQANSGDVSVAKDERTEQSQYAHNFPDLRITSDAFKFRFPIPSPNN